MLKQWRYFLLLITNIDTCALIDILATVDCSKYVSDTRYRPDFGSYSINFNAPDLEFDNPKDNANALFGIQLTVNITDSTLTGGDASLVAFFADKGIQLMYFTQVIWAKLLCYATKTILIKKNNS